MGNPHDQLDDLQLLQLQRILVPIRRDLRDYAACWARVLSFFVPGLGHVFIGATWFGLLYFTMSCAALSMVVVNRNGQWWPGVVGAVTIWIASLGHIHAQTRAD